VVKRQEKRQEKRKRRGTPPSASSKKLHYILNNIPETATIHIGVDRKVGRALLTRVRSCRAVQHFCKPL
jgi:hypothetical protein